MILGKDNWCLFLSDEIGVNEEELGRYLQEGYLQMAEPKPVGETEYVVIPDPENEGFGIWAVDTTVITDAITAKVKEISSYCDTKDAQPFEFQGQLYKVTDAVLKTMGMATALNLADNDPIPIPKNGNCWDNYNSTISTPFTVGMLKALYITGYPIPENNFVNMKQHIGAVMQLTTVEAVTNYDYSTGWR